MTRELSKNPLGVSMVIPGCNDGSIQIQGRGGIGGQCDRDGQCRSKLNLFRECSNSPLLRKKDIYMADDDIKCSDLVESVHGTVRNWDYSHDAIIVGSGNSGF